MVRVNQNEEEQDRANNEQEENEAQLQHFSHVHTLQRQVLQQPSQFSRTSTICDGCWLPCLGTIYACEPCDYALHEACAKTPRAMKHPSHPGHVLVLFAKPTYPNGTFTCDACGKRGTTFSFHCARCEFDLHLPCANLPLQVQHLSHPHPLVLKFQSPYGLLDFTCDMCRRRGRSSEWHYHCGSCSFDSQLTCANNAGPLQQQQQEELIDQYMQIAARSREEMERTMANVAAQAQMQSRAAVAEIIQRYQRQAMTPNFHPSVGFNGSGRITAFTPGNNSGGMESLVHNLSGISLNDGNGGGDATSSILGHMGSMNSMGNFPGITDSLGGGDPISSIVGQMGSMNGMGNLPHIIGNYSDPVSETLGQVGSDPGNLGDLMGGIGNLFFS